MQLFQLTINKPTTKDIFIYDEDTKEEVEKKARRAMSKGHPVTWPNGKTQWIESHPQMTDDFKLIWHSDGERIQCTDILKTVGEENETLKTRFVSYDKIFN